AGKYLGKGGGARPIDQLAARYPQNAGVLERLRMAGFGAGARTRATATQLQITAAELADMIASGLVSPQPAWVTELARLPPGGKLEISARPQPVQMAAHDPSGANPSARPEPKLHIDEIKPADARPAKPAKPAKPRAGEPRSGDILPDELEHFDKGHFAEEGKLTGGGHGHSNLAELQRRGFEELPATEVAKLRADERAYEQARSEHDERFRLRANRTNRLRAFERSLTDGKNLRKLQDPGLPAAERVQLELAKSRFDAAVERWKAENPAPIVGPRPVAEEFGLPTDYKTLSERLYYYRQPLGKTGAGTGGLASSEPIHVDAHTWFPPGWEAEPIMKLLEGKSSGITETTIGAQGGKSALKRTAWIRRAPDGTYEVAPPDIKQPRAEGYLKASMITPLDGAQRTVFPEMKQ
ncbi:MAG TPA: hypothetical protein VGC42_09305, partial [Kofleriaceae bacterium]